MKPHFLPVLLGVAAIGSTLADSCQRSRRQFLATAEGGESTVLVRGNEEVELICRPANEVGCRWRDDSDDDVLSDECRLTVHGAGSYRCEQGGSWIGAVQLTQSRHSGLLPYDEDRRHQSRHYRRMTEEEQREREERMATAHMCSDTGLLIEKHLLCDGKSDCENAEDEDGCGLPCGAPSAGIDSSLSAPTGQLYPHGASVSYTCRPGFAFRQTPGEYRRTCREGAWSDSPPVCHRNLAFGRPSTVTGRSVVGLGPELAVDGQVSTWAMLTATRGGQSLNVSLAENKSVDLVLVRTSSPRYEVALRSAENRTVCHCERNISPNPGLSGLGACTCPTTADGGPWTVEVVASGSGLSSLSVAEVAAFGVPSPVADDCALLDQPAHGHFESARFGSDVGVRLVCEAGYRASCTGVLACGAASRAVCRPITCPPPPTIPRAAILSNNGTEWSAVTKYRCAAGYQLYPPEQRTSSVCADGLWSLSHIFCLADSDRRVVAMRQGQQHALSMATLKDELETLLSGQLQLLRQLKLTQRRLQLVEQTLGITWEEMIEAEETQEEEEREEEEEGEEE